MKEKIIFFITLVALLFVGDGKKSIVDIVGVAGALALGAATVFTKKIRFPSGKIVYWWAALLFYLIIRLPFSDSVAYSLYATLRFVIAFLVFIIFANSDTVPRFFPRIVFGFVLIALSASAFIFFMPSARHWMPEMSLLSNVYGHHHVAYLLVFALPFVVWAFLSKQSWLNGLVTILFVVCLFLTRARGAWFIAALYFVYILFRGKIALRKGFRIIGAMFATILLFVFVATSLRPDYFRSPIFGSFRGVKSGFAAARLGYWTQGLNAFVAQPVFGTGLGTFYLSSLRYQRAPNSYSWFAHSLLVQMAVETGVIGMILIVGMFWSIGCCIKPQDNTRPIAEAVALSGLYGIYEMNFDYLVIWLLVWSALGLLVGKGKMIRLPKATFYIPLGIIAFLYVVFILAEAAQLLTKNRIFLQPYNTQRALAYLNTQTKSISLPQKQLDTIFWFHKKNPEVLAAAGLYEKAAEQDPQRVEYLAKYINLLLEQNDQMTATRVLGLDVGLSPFLTKELFVDVGRPSNIHEYYAKLYYFVGLVVLEENPEITRDLWTKARDIAPEWGYFSAELASLYYTVFLDEVSVNKVLMECQKDRYAKELCRSTMENVKHIPETGTYQKEIHDIQ